MSKKPAIAMPAARPATPDDFVAAGQPAPLPDVPKEKPKRLTIDIPGDLHQAFKIAAAASGKDMREIMLALIGSYVEGHK